MNDAHLHLMVNHVSLFAMLFGLCALIASMKRKSGDLRGLASALFVLAGIFAWIAFETGEGAEAILKKVDPGSENFITEHELAAIWALRSGILVGSIAIAMEWALRKKIKWFKPLQWALLIFAIHGCSVFAATAFLGGKVRHTEVRE